MKKKIIRKPQKDLPFKPVDSRITIDLSPQTFRHSDGFSKMMDRAHHAAMRDKVGYALNASYQNQR